MAEPLPSPPFVSIRGISNFRDIGGYATLNGQIVRRGLVFRSADSSKATAECLEKMSKELGMKAIFDLRSAAEIKRDGPERADVEVEKTDIFEPYGITRRWVPVFKEQDYGPEQVALRYKEYTRTGTEGFVKAYHDIAESGTLSYGTVFRHLAQQSPAPCLVHCTAGKDRTGVLTAFLLMLLGVPDEEIAEEYSLTDQGLASLKPLFIERLLKNPALSGNTDGVENMVSSKKENMLATLQMLRREFGSPEDYIRKNCGLSDQEVERLRQNLLQG